MIPFKRNRNITMLAAIGISGSGRVIAAPADQATTKEAPEAALD